MIYENARLGPPPQAPRPPSKPFAPMVSTSIIPFPPLVTGRRCASAEGKYTKMEAFGLPNPPRMGRCVGPGVPDFPPFDFPSTSLPSATLGVNRVNAQGKQGKPSSAETSSERDSGGTGSSAALRVNSPALQSTAKFATEQSHFKSGLAAIGPRETESFCRGWLSPPGAGRHGGRSKRPSHERGLFTIYIDTGFHLRKAAAGVVF